MSTKIFSDVALARLSYAVSGVAAAYMESYLLPFEGVYVAQRKRKAQEWVGDCVYKIENFVIKLKAPFYVFLKPFLDALNLFGILRFFQRSNADYRHVVALLIKIKQHFFLIFYLLVERVKAF